MSAPAHPDLVRRVTAIRQGRARRRGRLQFGLLALLVTGVALTLSLGQSWTPPGEVLRVLAGQDVPGAAFVVHDRIFLLNRRPMAPPHADGVRFNIAISSSMCLSKRVSMRRRRSIRLKQRSLGLRA